MAEVAFALRVLLPRLAGRAGLLALPAIDAGIGPADLPQGRRCNDLEYCTDRADETAERAVEEERDNDQARENNEPCGKSQGEELPYPEEVQDREREYKSAPEDEQENKPPGR